MLYIYNIKYYTITSYMYAVLGEKGRHGQALVRAEELVVALTLAKRGWINGVPAKCL